MTDEYIEVIDSIEIIIRKEEYNKLKHCRSKEQQLCL